MSDNTSFQQRIKKFSRFITTKIKRNHVFDQSIVVARRHSSYIQQPISKDDTELMPKDGRLLFYNEYPHLSNY